MHSDEVRNVDLAHQYTLDYIAQNPEVLYERLLNSRTQATSYQTKYLELQRRLEQEHSRPRTQDQASETDLANEKRRLNSVRRRTEAQIEYLEKKEEFLRSERDALRIEKQQLISGRREVSALLEQVVSEEQRIQAVSEGIRKSEAQASADLDKLDYTIKILDLAARELSDIYARVIALTGVNQVAVTRNIGKRSGIFTFRFSGYPADLTSFRPRTSPLRRAFTAYIGRKIISLKTLFLKLRSNLIESQKRGY